MPIRLREVYVPLDHTPDVVRTEAARLLGVRADAFASFEVARRAVDARRKSRIKFVYTVELTLADASREADAAAAAPGETAHRFEPAPQPPLVLGTRDPGGPVVVVGAGPAGLFAALRLAENGYAPVIVERGRAVEARREDVRRFARDGVLDETSNVVCGEGGAGAYSDGKLTHRADSPEAREVIRTLVECGAPADILVEAKPHVGSDVLPGVIERLRTRIERAGGWFAFGRRATGFELASGTITQITLAGGGATEQLRSGAIVLAPGSSARDTWRDLQTAGVALTARPTLIGIRVEHPQAVIDRSQFGPMAGHPALGAAEYAVASGAVDGRRPVHSFCMCPGGWVIPVAAQPGMLSTNGMSKRTRASGYANAALVAPVNVEDYGTAGPLAGVEFIERLERATFELGGRDYSLPCQRLIDFIEGRSSGQIAPGAKGIRRRMVALGGVLPQPVEQSLRAAARLFDRKVRGFVGPHATAYGFELRTGSPVRIERDEEGSSPSAVNLFPAGEGAGYAGGIISSAVDGLRQAGRLISRYARPRVARDLDSPPARD